MTTSVKNDRLQFSAIGTRWNIQINQPVTHASHAEIRKKIQRRIESFDKAYSRFRSDSLVAEISRREGTYELPPDGFALLQYYEQLYKATSGKVTPLVGQLIADAGYDAAYSFKPRPLKPVLHWEEVLSYDTHSLTTTQPVLLDFGAAGKGYLVDLIDDLLRRDGLESYIIDAGGDILHRAADSGEAVVGLENPLDTSEAIATIAISNQSLCASAGNKRRWQDFHHIIDPDTLRSPKGMLGTWVLADSAMLADGLATALFFTPASELHQHFSFSYVILYEDMSLQHTPKLSLNIFSD